MMIDNTSTTGKEATGMRCANQGRFRHQTSFLRRQFRQDEGLPFTNVLTERVIARALSAISGCWLDRIYSPLSSL
jgi:hypothetical protein